MKHEIKTSSSPGNAIRAVRKTSGVRLDDLVAIRGVSKQTTGNREYGKDTVAIGTVLRHLSSTPRSEKWCTEANANSVMQLAEAA